MGFGGAWYGLRPHSPFKLYGPCSPFPHSPLHVKLGHPPRFRLSVQGSDGRQLAPFTAHWIAHLDAPPGHLKRNTALGMMDSVPRSPRLARAPSLGCKAHHKGTSRVAMPGLHFSTSHLAPSLRRTRRCITESHFALGLRLAPTSVMRKI